MGGGTHNKNNKNNEITMETQNLNTHGKKRKLSILQQQKTLETIHQQKGGGSGLQAGPTRTKKHTQAHTNIVPYLHINRVFSTCHGCVSIITGAYAMCKCCTGNIPIYLCWDV